MLRVGGGSGRRGPQRRDRGAVAAGGKPGGLGRGRRPAKGGVAGREAAEAADDLAVDAGVQQVVGAGRRHPGQEQPHAAVLVGLVLGMLEGQVEELPPGFGKAQVPAQVDGLAGGIEGEGVGGEGLRPVAEHVAPKTGR